MPCHGQPTSRCAFCRHLPWSYSRKETGSGDDEAGEGGTLAQQPNWSRFGRRQTCAFTRLPCYRVEAAMRDVRSGDRWGPSAGVAGRCGAPPFWPALVSVRGRELHSCRVPHKPVVCQAFLRPWVGGSHKAGGTVWNRSLETGHLSGLSTWNQRAQSQAYSGGPRSCEIAMTMGSE